MQSIISISFFLLFLLPFQTDKYKQAQTCLNNNEFDKVVEICNAELKKVSKSDALYNKYLSLRASAFGQSGNGAAAITDYKLLLIRGPNVAENYGALSFYYGQTGNYAACDAVLLKALNLFPHDVTILNNAAYYAALDGRFDKTISYANKGLLYVKDDHNKALLLNNRGYGLIGQHRYTEALADINKSLVLHEDNPFAYCYRAIANINLKKMETVCTDLTKAKKMGAVELTKDLLEKHCR